jgi:hypothetical protein
MEEHLSVAARDAVMGTVQGMIRNSSRVARASDAMRARGLSQGAVETEIALALVCCIWETSRGLPDRFAQVCDGLAKGLTTEQMFPNTIKDSRKTPRAYGPSGAKAS